MRDIFSRTPSAPGQDLGENSPWGGARLIPCDPVPWSPPGQCPDPDGDVVKLPYFLRGDHADPGDAVVKLPERPSNRPPATNPTNADLWPGIRVQDYPPDPALSPEQQSLHEINLNAARLRSRAAMLQLQENDLGASQQAHDASLARLQNGVTGPESRQALDQHDYNRADLAVRQHTLRTGREQLQQAQADQDARVQAHQDRFAAPSIGTLSYTTDPGVPSPAVPSGDAAAASSDAPAPASPDAATAPPSPANGADQPPPVPQPASPPAPANDPLAAYQGIIGQTLADLAKGDPDDAARISQRLEQVPPGDREQVLNAIIARHKGGDRGSPQPDLPPGVATPPAGTESHTISGNSGDITINGVRHVDTGKEPTPAPAEPGISNHDNGAPLTAEQFMAGLEAGGVHLSPKDRAQIEEIYSRRLKPEPPPTFLDKFLAAVQLPFQGLWNYAGASRGGGPTAHGAAKTLGLDFPMDAGQTRTLQESTDGLLTSTGGLAGAPRQSLSLPAPAPRPVPAQVVRPAPSEEPAPSDAPLRFDGNQTWRQDRSGTWQPVPDEEIPPIPQLPISGNGQAAPGPTVVPPSAGNSIFRINGEPFYRDASGRIQHIDPEGSVTLTPLDPANPGHAAIIDQAQPQPKPGAGAAPIGAPGTPWTKPSYWQGPSSKRGSWAGQEGNSEFHLNDQTAEEYGVPRGTRIPFVTGSPDFSGVAVPMPDGTPGVFEVPGLKGFHDVDQNMIRTEITRITGMSRGAVDDWLKNNKICLHHFLENTVHLAPENYHQIHHTGGAAYLRSK